jgi:acetyl esterase/lipase
VRRALRASIGDIADLRSPSGQEVSWRLDLRRLLFPFWMSDPAVERLVDIPYVDDGRRRHRLDIFRPKGGVRGAPVLLQIHGGAWILGDKAQQGLPVLYHLAARGWVCVSINYALSPRATWPDHLIDCKRALAWVREHVADYGGDPDFVVVTGGSAGGHLASLVALTPNEPAYQPGFEDVDTRVRGFVPFYGVYDWTNRFGIRSRIDRLADLLQRLVIKKPYEEAPEIYAEASPMDHLDGDIPPVMILHGTHDTLAPVEEARRFADMVAEVSDQPVVYAEMQGAHHAFEIFASVRAMHAVRGVEAFLAWLTRDHGREGARVPRDEARDAREETELLTAG